MPSIGTSLHCSGRLGTAAISKSSSWCSSRASPLRCSGCAATFADCRTEVANHSHRGRHDRGRGVRRGSRQRPISRAALCEGRRRPLSASILRQRVPIGPICPKSMSRGRTAPCPQRPSRPLTAAQASVDGFAAGFVSRPAALAAGARGAGPPMARPDTDVSSRCAAQEAGFASDAP